MNRLILNLVSKLGNSNTKFGVFQISHYTPIVVSPICILLYFKRIFIFRLYFLKKINIKNYINVLELFLWVIKFSPYNNKKIILFLCCRRLGWSNTTTHMIGHGENYPIMKICGQDEPLA